MKIIINTCYGGFSLSPRAIKRLAELNNKECYFFKNIQNENDTINLNKFEKISLQAAEKQLFFSAFSVKNPNVYLSKKSWKDMTDQERIKDNKIYDDIYLTSRPDDRTGKLLIQVIEELGEKKASGKFASLKIIEIPDDIDYTIEEYDGREHIAESHRTWS